MPGFDALLKISCYQRLIDQLEHVAEVQHRDFPELCRTIMEEYVSTQSTEDDELRDRFGHLLKFPAEQTVRDSPDIASRYRLCRFRGSEVTVRTTEAEIWGVETGAELNSTQAGIALIYRLAEEADAVAGRTNWQRGRGETECLAPESEGRR